MAAYATADLDLRASLAGLSAEWRAAVDRRSQWLAVCRAEQLEPLGDGWNTWLALAGRGWGKTRTLCEWLWWEAWGDPGSRSAIISPTNDDLRKVIFEGESGLVACVPPELVAEYNKSLHYMVLTNGSLIQGYSSEKPGRLRGPQHHRAACDELREWQYPEQCWDNLQFGLRLGVNPRVMVATTSKPQALLQRLLADPATVYTGGNTYENRANLSAKFFNEVAKYEGTTVGRQEIWAEMIDPEEMGVYKRSWFKLWPAFFSRDARGRGERPVPLPKFSMVIQSWDTAFTEESTDDQGDPDPSAMTVWGVFNPRESLPRELLTKYKCDVPAAVMLCDAFSDYLGYPELLARVQVENARVYGPKPGRKTDLLLIEDKGSGRSLQQSLRKEGVYARPYNPGKASKLQRAHATSHLPFHGLVWVPESSLPTRKDMPRDWCEPYLQQVCAFAGEGTVPHDDFVDTTTQMLEYLHRTGVLTVLLPPEGQFADARQAKDLRRPNPYTQQPEGRVRRVKGNPYAGLAVEQSIAVDADGSLRE